MTYPSLDEQIKIFPAYILWNTKLKKILLRDKNDYSHDSGELHHFIKEQEYYKNPDKYKGKQKLILMAKETHKDLHSAMSDERFKEKWGIEKTELLHRHRII